MPAGNASILKEQYGFDAAAAREELIRLAGRFHGKRVLDVGTGCGSLAVVLAQHGFAVTTIDINADSLNCIRERTDHLSRKTVDRIRFVKADALRLPFRSQTFDGVFSFDSLHHMPDCPATVAEMLRVLTPGGVLAVADLNEIGAQAVADVIARRGESHFHNGCGADVVGEILLRNSLAFHRHPLEFVTVFVARSLATRNPGHG